MLRPFCLLGFLGSVLFLGSSFADTPAELNQRLGACGVTADRVKKAQCFEKLARDAIIEVERKAAAEVIPPVVPTASNIGNYSEFVANAKESLTRDFKDPSSVLWRNLYINDDKFPTLCGELNGKNSYGAYVGFKRFFFVKPALQEVESSENSYVINEAWKSICAKRVQTIE